KLKINIAKECTLPNNDNGRSKEHRNDKNETLCGVWLDPPTKPTLTKKKIKLCCLRRRRRGACVCLGAMERECAKARNEKRTKGRNEERN
ncbi:hypothetical protein VIGAN_01328000, partial [Vigna angularis var. angularis]